jgi:hypothetical protein
MNAASTLGAPATIQAPGRGRPRQPAALQCESTLNDECRNDERR